MDDLLDVLDGIDALTDLGDLADAGVDLAELLDHDALSGLDLAWLMDITHLDGASDGVDGLSEALDGFDVGDSGDVAGGMVEAVLPSGEVVELFVPSPETVPEMVELGLASYPGHLLDGLGSVDYIHDSVAEDWDTLGQWSVDADGAAHISLFGHSESALETLHHEVGHHIVEGNTDFRADLLEAIDHDGFADDQADFLEGYAPQLRDGEACAEAIGKFMANPFAFATRWPAVAALLRSRLGR